MRILGIDPGLSITGFGLIETGTGGPRLVDAGCLRNAASVPLEKRLLEIHKGIRQVLHDGKPDTVAVEALFSNYKHPGAALQMAHARGVLFLAIAEFGLPVFAYEPARVKKSLTGRGQATKAQMQRMVQKVFSLPAPPTPADIADAIAVALCHANSFQKGFLRSKRAGKMPDGVQELIGQARSRAKGRSAIEEILERVGAKR